jgi:hypothetical protein|nr:hypothetical protein [Ferrovum sp.]
MSLRSRARFFLPKNPFIGLSLTYGWIRKIQETRIEQERVPIRNLSPEDRQKRLRYWKRTERQNMLIGMVVFGFLIADMLAFHDVLAVVGTLGAGIFVGAHWYYAHRMKQLLSENIPADGNPAGSIPAGSIPAVRRTAGNRKPAKEASL